MVAGCSRSTSRETVARIVSGEKTLPELSRELGISPSVLRNWMRLVERGGTTAVAAGEDVVPASRFRCRLRPRRRSQITRTRVRLPSQRHPPQSTAPHCRRLQARPPHQPTASGMAAALAKGDTSGLDRMNQETEAAKESLAALTPPASCAAHHRGSLGSLDDALEILRSLKTAMESPEPAAQLPGVAARATPCARASTSSRGKRWRSASATA